MEVSSGEGRLQAYVASLGQIVRSTHFDLREAMDQFQGMCSRVTSERIVPAGMITDIRQTYKEIQDQLTKIRGIHQLLESKYRGYYRRDSDREREFMEFAFLAKSLYSKFEYTLQEIEAKRKLREGGEHVVAYRQRLPFPWFHSEENQIILLRNLRDLRELDYKTWSDSESAQRRRIIWDGPRSVSLFALSGEEPLIDTLQSRMHLREYDIKERLTKEELRGALTHLREISLLGSGDGPETFHRRQRIFKTEMPAFYDSISTGSRERNIGFGGKYLAQAPSKFSSFFVLTIFPHSF